MTSIKTILTIVSLLQAIFLYSQTWPKYFGEPNRKDYSYDIVETYDKGYLLCGGYFNDESTWSWLIKTDRNGDTLWEKVLDCDEFNYLNAVHQTIDGGLIACGAIKYPSYSAMPYVVKFDACGQKLWCKSFYTQEDLPWAQDIKETESGDIIVLVNQFGDSPEETMHLFKLNADGDVIWKKPFCSGYVHPEGAIPLGKKVIITSNNDYLIAGEVYWEDPWNPGGPKPLRPLFVMVDSIGSEKWVLPFGLSDTIYGKTLDIIETSYNSYIGAGYYWPNQGYDEGLIMKFDDLGNEINYKKVNAKEIDTVFNRVLFYEVKKFDTLFAFGGVMGVEFVGNPTMETVSDTNLFNNVTFNNYIQHTELITPYSLAKAGTNKLLSNSTLKQTGNWDIALSKLNLNLEYDTLDPGNYTYDSLCTTPGLPQSGFIYLDDCDIITDVPSPEEYYAFINTIPVKVYPNPVNGGEVTFEFENTEHHRNITLKCFNLMGKQFYETSIITGQREAGTDVNHWPQGMYLVVVYSDGLPVGRCKFVVQ